MTEHNTQDTQAGGTGAGESPGSGSGQSGGQEQPPQVYTPPTRPPVEYIREGDTSRTETKERREGEVEKGS
jgi:hypothetical protein